MCDVPSACGGSSSGGGGNLCSSSNFCSGSSSIGAGGPSREGSGRAADAERRRQGKQPIRRTADSPGREWEREQRQLMRAHANSIREWHIPPLITAEPKANEVSLSEIQLSTERTIFDRIASERRSLAAARRASEVAAPLAPAELPAVGAQQPQQPQQQPQQPQQPQQQPPQQPQQPQQQQPAGAEAAGTAPETDTGDTDVPSTPRSAATPVDGASTPERSATPAGQRSVSERWGLGLPADGMQLVRRLSGLGDMLGQSPLAQVCTSTSPHTRAPFLCGAIAPPSRSLPRASLT